MSANIDETTNYLIEEINWNELMSKKHKNVYFENFLILNSTITGCVSISSLDGIPKGITNSVTELKIFAITSEIKKYKSII